MNIKRFIGITLGIAAVTSVGATKSNAAVLMTQTKMDTYSCSDASYGSSGTYFTASGAGSVYATSSRSAYTTACEGNNTSNAAGSVVTAAETLRAATAQTAGLISNRISFVRNQASTRVPYSVSLDGNGNAHLGLAGGMGDKGIGVWVQGSITHIANDAAASKYNGNVITGLVGADKAFKNGFLVGLSAGYEDVDLDTTFNSGNLKGRGYIVAPYAAFDLKKGFSVNTSFGYARVRYDQDRLDPSTSEKFTSDGTNADRYFGTLNLNASKKVKKATVGGTLGIVYSREERASFTETGTTGTKRVTPAQTTSIGQPGSASTPGLTWARSIPTRRSPASMTSPRRNSMSGPARPRRARTTSARTSPSV